MMMFSFMNTHSQRQAEGDYYKPSACARNAVGPRFKKGRKFQPRRQTQRNEKTVAVWMPTVWICTVVYSVCAERLSAHATRANVTKIGS